MFRSLLLTAATLACFAHAPFSRAEEAAPACPNDTALPPLIVPHLRAALAAGHQGLIVALGSSSTQGVGASNAARTYPAALQADLGPALPDAHIAVVNRGISGQDAIRELARMDEDVIALRPQLVIWQVGANAALRLENPEDFQRIVATGVRKLRQAGIDVVLMDNQRSPRILASGHSDDMNRALAEVADRDDAQLFSRDRLMAAWERVGAPDTMFVSKDRLHMNDRGYACIAEALSRALKAGLRLSSGIAGADTKSQPRPAHAGG